MIASLKKIFKWGPAKHLETKKNQGSLLLTAFIGLFEDILLWKKMWLSLSCIFFLNVLFLICIHWQINILESIFCSCLAILSMDAFETWLKYKHRTACLKKWASHSGSEFNTVILNIKNWMRRRWMEFIYLRETNHTKAFLLVSIFFSILFLVGKYINGYVLLYLLFMSLCVLRKIAPPIHRFIRKIQQNADSDGELEGLIPDISDVDIKLLSIEPEQPIIDDRQSLDYWKPEDLPLEDGSDSSEHSSSLVTNLSMDKMKTFDKDVETSDSSEDEYIPLEQQKELQSTLEVIQPASTWSSSAYNALFNITGAMANMMYSTPEQTKRKRVSSVDSSDGFEMIDKNDLN
ncbi:uncharacterized protein LOC126367689 [Pectinophora gossypiella]|uniref:RETREG1-3/ARL6IP-like N-terminal reticulon-homology domain-containing protein n=1 Tax=Pectinophora gossypiella TaxID=13191 RepID=A0A1E1WSN3_PECGO|nr:uncharacterized protein LOC126367689 [Pectinophora gossypiella]